MKRWFRNWIVVVLVLVLFQDGMVHATDPDPLNQSKLTSATSSMGGLSASELELVEQAYVWGWPLVYMSNLQKSLRMINRPGISGSAPVAPVNYLSMMTEPVSSDFVSAPCPNTDVLYGFSVLDLNEGPVVLQIPDFGDRFWLIQAGDHRTDSFAELGSIYQTKPGNYLIVGPSSPEGNNEQINLSDGFVQVIRSPTSLAFLIPRVLISDDADDSLARTIQELSVYPYSKYTGKKMRHDWSKKRWYPALRTSTRSETKSVAPDRFFSDLQEVIHELPPMPNEEALYEQLKTILHRASSDTALRETLIALAQDFEREQIQPLFDFRNFGERLPTRWTTVSNGAAFGTDYLSRTAVAKSNIFVNRASEAKYFYLEQDIHGNLLEGSQTYELTFAKADLPSNRGFWSITLYDAEHRLHPNEESRYSISSRNRRVRFNENGSLTIVVSASRPDSDMVENWLPAPSGPFVLYLRVYAPAQEVIVGDWMPPGAFPRVDFRRQARLP